MANKHSYHITGSADELYPVETYYGLLQLEDRSMVDIPQQYPFPGPWGGYVVENVPLNDELSLPYYLELTYLSIVEKKFYYISIPINPAEITIVFEKPELKNHGETSNFIIGMAPYGEVAIWIGNRLKQLLLGWIIGKEIMVDMQSFMPEKTEYRLSDYCDFYINNDSLVKENLEKNGLPPRDLFDNYMKQFTYRYLPVFEHWDNDNEAWEKYEEEEVQPEFDYIEEALFDGTHDKLHDGGLMIHHEAGKPKKLAIKWRIKKSEYSAYLWFEDEEIRAAFDRFYGPHPDTKTDFIIHIDPEMKKYELALYRYGLKEPYLISKSAYQLIVFKNKFEHYRSDNYSQPRGAWIW